MNRETAVELLVDAIRGHIADGTLDAITLSRAKMIAKAMEREQIHAAFDSGVCHALFPERNPLHYYDDTYKGGKHE